MLKNLKGRPMKMCARLKKHLGGGIITQSYKEEEDNED